MLDSVIKALEREPHVRAVAAYPTTGDTTFISRDLRTSLILVALAPLGSDSISKLVMPTRALLRETLRRAGADSGWHSYVTGRSPLDLDTRRLTTEDSRRGELQLLPFTFVILVLAFGALVAALLPILIGVDGDRRVARHRGRADALHVDVDLRAHHRDDDRARRGHRLLAPHGHALPRGAEPGTSTGATPRSTRSSPPVAPW